MARHLSSKTATGVVVLVAAAVVATCAAVRQPATAATFDGAGALAHAGQLVAIGPRVAGTEGAAKARTYIAAELKKAGLSVTEQAFEATTPLGPTRMVNLMAAIPGRSSAAPRIIVAGHYDTKRFTDIEFVGANDGGSSAAFLLALASALKPRTLAVDVELLFLDGEEAVVDWVGTDHTYGSRHYVETARAAGALDRIGAMVLVDMIGDKDLDILRETNSTRWLTDILWSTAARMGRREFVAQEFAVEDDHLEFLEAGVPAVDIIDLDYPAWHKAGDRMDQLSSASFQAVGDVLLAALPQIADRVAR
jgi:Peptidase family M28